jgi:hypothetical protein
MSEDLWKQLDRRAAHGGLTRSFVLAVLARDYANFELDVPHVRAGSEPTRSARISEEVWRGLAARAASERVAATRVLVALAEEYVAGRIALHVHVVSSQVPFDKAAGSP